jgi:hypothetical protein
MSLKKVGQRKVPLIQGEIFGTLGRDLPEWVLKNSGIVIFELCHQRRHNIEILVHLGKFFQQLHHSVIVLERVQTHPWKAIFTAYQVLVKGLVHMPEEEKSELALCHRSMNPERAC